MSLRNLSGFFWSPIIIYIFMIKYLQNKKWIVVIVATLLSSCEIEKKYEVLHTANPKTIEENIPYDKVVDSYKYIPLENNPKCVIGEVKNLLIANDLFYVVSEGVYCFNMDGKFLFAINKKGHAKSEYVDVYSVNVTGNRLYLYDNSQWKILVFDALSGKYRETIDIPYSAFLVYGGQERLLLDRCNLPNTEVPNNERFLVCSTQSPQKTLDCFLPQDILRKSCHIENTTTINSDGFLCSDFWGNTIWKVTPNSAQCYFKINLPTNKSLPYEKLKLLEEKGEIFLDDFPDGKYWGLTHAQESEHFITGQLMSMNGPAFFIYDKDSSKVIVYTGMSKKEGWKPVPAYLSATYKDSFFSIRSADEFCMLRLPENSIAGPSESEDEQNASKIYNSIQETDNPIIIQFEFKHIK